LGWFGKELQELQDCPSVNLIVYITQEDAPSNADSMSDSMNVTSDIEKNNLVFGDVEKGSPVVGNFEKTKEEVTGQTTVSISALRKGRPDIAVLIADCLSQCSEDEYVGIGACGPISIIKSTREVACRSTFDNGPFITLHTEVSEVLEVFQNYSAGADSISGI
jgi:hypothetical protein